MFPLHHLFRYQPCVYFTSTRPCFYALIIVVFPVHQTPEAGPTVIFHRFCAVFRPDSSSSRRSAGVRSLRNACPQIGRHDERLQPTTGRRRRSRRARKRGQEVVGRDERTREFGFRFAFRPRRYLLDQFIRPSNPAQTCTQPAPLTDFQKPVFLYRCIFHGFHALSTDNRYRRRSNISLPQERDFCQIPREGFFFFGFHVFISCV